MPEPISTPAEMREAAALLATSFLVGDPKNGVPLRNPMAHEIAAAIRALPVAEPQKPQAPVTLTYTNWRGETAERTITPQSIWFGSTEWHPEPQWLLRAWDCEKQAERDFAMKDFGQKPEPMAVRVKPLQWVDFNDRGAKAQAWGEANYLIQRWSDGRYELSASYPGYCTDIPGGGFYPSKESALAAAEADHATRILSQIEAVSVAQVRAEALDDAARAVSERSAYWWDEATAADDTGRKKLSLIYEAKALACTELAAAIRAMKGTTE